MTPRICFLGLYERMVQITTASGMPIAVNMLGLTDQVISTLYPLSFAGLGMALAIFEPSKKETITLVFREQVTQHQLEITVGTEIVADVNPEATRLGHGWVKVFGPAPKNQIVPQPGQYAVFVQIDSKEEFLGYLNFHYSESLPLTEAVIEAIKADPFATKFARFTLSCNKCHDEFRCYTGIHRGGDSEAAGWIWQGDIPEQFVCKCGAASVSLAYVKKGLHSVLQRRDNTPYSITKMVALYEKSALEQYCREFRDLLDSKPKKEEVLQKFLDEHKVFLHRFAAMQILTKPPVLSKFAADFIILNNRKELLLIEIERSTIKLLKKTKGSFGITADLQHAFDQVRSWRQIFDDFRDAALANIGIDKKEVAKIRGVVIAGRTPGDEEEARYLRGLSLDVDLFTYDDLISDVVESITHIAQT
jgi:hypothetical protein